MNPPRYHRLFISSKDVVNGSQLNGFYNLKLPSDISSKKVMVVVDSLVIEDTTNNVVLDNNPIEMRVDNLYQVNTFNTHNPANNTLIIFKGTEYHNYATTQTIGNPIVDTSSLHNTFWNIWFYSPTLALTTSNFDGDWSALLLFVELE